MASSRPYPAPRLAFPKEIPIGKKGQSSVLILLGRNQEGDRDEILLTKRTDSVETHKGQVSFPGGYWETHDSNLLQTALRESFEDIGTLIEHIEVLGALEPVHTRGDILIQPWVGRLDFPYPFALSTSEVAKLLFLPLDRLLQEGLSKVEIDVGCGHFIQGPGIYVDGELVWGATARMLEMLKATF